MPTDPTIEARALELFASQFGDTPMADAIRHNLVGRMGGDQDMIDKALRAITAALTPQVADERREAIARIIDTALGVFPDGLRHAESTNGITNLAWLTADAILAAQPKAGAVDREAVALAICNEQRAFHRLPPFERLSDMEPHHYRDQLRYADAILKIVGGL